MARGKFIVFEGLDGAGTTTQQTAVAEALERIGFNQMETKTIPRWYPGEGSFIVTAQPSNGPAGLLIRQVLNRGIRLPAERRIGANTLAELFAMDREHHLRTVVLPALEAGHHVLCDRYVLSSLAYQDTAPLVQQLNEPFPPADLTLFLSVGASIAAARRQATGRTEDLMEAIEKQRRVEKAYEDAIRSWGRRENVVRIDGVAKPETVTEDCLYYVGKLLGV